MCTWTVKIWCHENCFSYIYISCTTNNEHTHTLALALLPISNWLSIEICICAEKVVMTKTNPFFSMELLSNAVSDQLFPLIWSAMEKFSRSACLNYRKKNRAPCPKSTMAISVKIAFFSVFVIVVIAMAVLNLIIELFAVHSSQSHSSNNRMDDTKKKHYCFFSRLEARGSCVWMTSTCNSKKEKKIWYTYNKMSKTNDFALYCLFFFLLYAGKLFDLFEWSIKNLKSTKSESLIMDV